MGRSKIMKSERESLIRFGYRPDLLNPNLSRWLDHFRWISALAVAGSHLRNMLMPDAANLGPLAALFYFLTLFAEQAVVIFFVLSGLLVGGVIVRGVRERRFVPRKYAIDRATRLYVALVPAVALSVALQWSFGAVSCPTPDRALRIVGNLIFIQNFGGTPPCNNASLWSLSSEGYFYLVGPMLIFAAFSRSARAMFLAALALVPAILVFEPSRITPLFGLSLWLCGLAPWFVHVRLRAWIAALPLIGVLLASRLHLLPGAMLEEALIALAFALLLSAELRLLRAPAARVAASFASFSYSLYLVQMPIAQTFGRLWGYQALPSGAASTYARYCLALAVIIATAWVIGRLFEAQTGWARGQVMRFLRVDPAKSAQS